MISPTGPTGQVEGSFTGIAIIDEYRHLTMPYRILVSRLNSITPPPGGIASLPKMESLSELYD